MDIACAEFRRSKKILLTSTENGTTEISEQALSSLIRFAAAAIPGSAHDAAATCVRAPPASPLKTAHRWSLLMPAPTSSSILGSPPLQAISSALPAGVGIGAGTINITVEDLYDA